MKWKLVKDFQIPKICFKLNNKLITVKSLSTEMAGKTHNKRLMHI